MPVRLVRLLYHKAVYICVSESEAFWGFLIEKEYAKALCMFGKRKHVDILGHAHTLLRWHRLSLVHAISGLHNCTFLFGMYLYTHALGWLYHQCHAMGIRLMSVIAARRESGS